MLTRLKQRARLRRNAAELYGAIVSAARAPELFRDFAVPDNPMGRLESILLHLALAIERLQREGEAGQGLARALAEAYVTDMDDSLREIGIGDMGVPRRVKQAAGALFERHRSYAASLALPDDGELGLCLARSLLARERGPVPAGLVNYVRRAHSALASQEGRRLIAGEIEFPAPQAATITVPGAVR